MNTIHVHLLPPSLEGGDLSRSVAVAIDILRASTTIIHALANGAKGILPCLTVEQAREWAASSEEPLLLGGERGGQLIEGFDLDNSPLAYVSDQVAGRTIVFTTTNGTRALARCAGAERVLIGAFVNESALVRQLEELHCDVHLVCAGTEGEMTAEDVLFAGAVASRLQQSAPESYHVDPFPAQMAVDYYRARSASEATFRHAMFESRGARNLLQLGHREDVERSLQRNLFEIVPAWDPVTNQIV